ncbi:universal stress protein [Pseudodesulfovibrio indicus]|uniref:universal stress protein n=1 Tax=Pseudodesulfovibrio indicus TaxID=1716143 RepID=UPI002931889C|nr:universal stress protein [Pseudodesulfovibrio indicus]
MFKNILLDLGAGVDGELIAHVAEFCERADASLTILNVFEEPSKSVSTYFSSHHKDLQKLVIENHETKLAEEMANNDIDFSKIKNEIRWGKDFIETIKLVIKNKYDLVISTSQEPSGAPDSTAMHLLRKCPCPVWIHRGDLWRGAVRILAAINTSDASEENQKLNQKIIDHGMRLTEILRGHLHIVTCWSGYMESVLTSPRFSEKERVDYLEYEQRQTEKLFEALLATSNLKSSVKGKIIHGNPAKVIPHYALEQKMDIVVMGSVARAGIPGLLVGNTAEKIVASLENSILAIKPEGFVSPVK